MYAKIHLSFSESGKLLQDFLSSISEGHLRLALSKNYQPGEKLDLEVILPALENPFRIQAQVKSRNPRKSSVDALITNQTEVEKLLRRLYELPAYNEFMEESAGKSSRLELEEITELSYDSEIEEPVAIVKPRKVSPRDSLPLSSDFLKPIKNFVSRVILPPVKGRAPVARLQLHLKKDPAKIRAHHPEKVAAIPVEEKVRKPPANVSRPDPLLKLKRWLEIEEELIIEDEILDKEIEASPPEPEPAPAKSEPTDLGQVSLFLQFLIKALQRNSYYSPEHPGYNSARERLYRDFKNALSPVSELGIIIAHPSDSSPEFFITGLSPLPITFEKLMSVSASEFFFPRYLDYFQSRRLVCLFLKPSLSQDQFYRFLEIMSQPPDQLPDSHTPIGRILTGEIIESQIKEVLAIFEEDRLYLPSGLPWQLEIAIHRFAKELKILPLFQEVTLEQMPQLKARIIHNILCSLQNPELLKEFIFNIEAITRQVPGLDEEDPENDLIQNLPFYMLLSTADLILKEFSRLSQLQSESKEPEQNFASRLESARRILKKIALHLSRENHEAGYSFLEQTFVLDLIPLKNLPQAPRKKLNRQQMVSEFQKHPQSWLGRFANANSANELKLISSYFSAIIPSLLQRKDWQNLYLITEAASRLARIKQNTLAESGIQNLLQALWEKGAPDLVQCLWDQNPETRKGLNEIFVLLGEFGIQILYQTLLQEGNSTRKKFLIESLLKFGPDSLEKLRDILRDPAKPSSLQALALEAIGRSRCHSDAEMVQSFLNHPKHELRIQALTALTRILGPDSLEIIEPLLSDPHPMVRKRIILMFGLFAGKNSYARNRLMEIAFDPQAEEDLRTTALQELAKTPPDDEKERQTLQDKILELVLEEETLAQKIKRKFSKNGPEQELLKLACLDLIGKIGDQIAFQKLSQLNYSFQTLNLRKEQALNQLRLRLQ